MNAPGFAQHSPSDGRMIQFFSDSISQAETTMHKYTHRQGHCNDLNFQSSQDETLLRIYSLWIRYLMNVQDYSCNIS